MAEPYLSDLRSIVTQTAPSDVSVVCKHFFGGAAAYVEDRIFATLTPVGLAFKMADATRDALLDRDATPLRYFPSAPIKREYVLFTDPDALEAPRLTRLMAQSITHVAP